MAMMDFRGQGGGYQFPSRKPVPAAQLTGGSGLQPLTRIVPDIDLPVSGHHEASPIAPSFSFPRRGPSSSYSPSSPQYYNPANAARRTPSGSISSNPNTGYIPNRTPSTASTTVSRTASTRSGSSISTVSYVASMRKQKATVWCDRAQHEDPRIVAQHKAAKMRAAREVSGGNMEGRTSTGSMGSSSLGVRSKIRHHGVPKATGYSYANMVGGGVPMRLSASEVGDDRGYDEDGDSQRNSHHERTPSGKSSLSSNKWLTATNPRGSNRYSEGSTPNSTQGGSPGGQGSTYREDIPELEETPVPGEHKEHGKGDYFARSSGHGGSGSSSEMETSFGKVGQLNGSTENSARREDGKSAEELRRRGSVDERANTMSGMSGVRLFVANPDLSD